ncbi:hypothetical protein ABIB40_001678 [Pedobacter sp. UYP30]
MSFKKINKENTANTLKIMDVFFLVIFIFTINYFPVFQFHNAYWINVNLCSKNFPTIGIGRSASLAALIMPITAKMKKGNESQLKSNKSIGIIKLINRSNILNPLIARKIPNDCSR